MFEKIVEKIIQSCLSDYIQGLESQQLKVSLWSGKIELENVMLNPEILIKLQLPMVFKFTRIRKIDVVIPWSALTTKSVEIKINGIYCVAVPFEMDRWSLNLNYLVEKVKESLKNYEVWWMFEKEKKNAEQGEGKKGYLDEVKNKVLSNLKVFLEDFHLRYEDDFDKNPYSMGVRIKSVKVLPQSLNKNLLEVKDFYFYINLQDPHFEDIENQIALENNDSKVLECKNYLVNTSITMEMNGNERIVDGNIDGINFELTHLQLIHFIQLHQKFSEYSAFLAQQQDQKKYLIFSPIERNPRNLWKFGIETVLRILRQKKEITDIFVMNYRFKLFYRENFKLLFKKCRTEKLSPEEESLYNKILYLCDWESLVEWEYAVLDELNQKKKEKGGWLWFGKKAEKEVFVPTVYKDIFIPPLPESISTILTLSCELVELKLATYSIEKELIQSQSLSLRKTQVLCRLSDLLSSIKLSISSLHIEYQDLDSRDTLLKMNSSEDLPSLKASLKLFTDLKTPNQIKYRSQFLEVYANPKAVSHLMNFVSLKALSEANKKNIVDRLKQIQEKALNQISDIFYYQKTYKIGFSSPSFKVFVPSKSGVFVLSLGELNLKDREGPGLENYSAFDTGMTVEVLFNDLKIVPQFQVSLQVNTLNKIFLCQKWEMKESPYDSCYDICLSGMIENVQIYFYTLLIDEFKYLETNLKFHETQELLILNKASIVKDAEKISPVTLNSGFISQTCLAVLKNDTIYFFQNEKAQQAFNFYLLTGSTVNRQENEISVKKPGKSIILKFNKENICERWFYLLLTKVELKVLPVLSKRYEKEVLKFDFAIHQAQSFVISNDMEVQYHLFMGKQQFSSIYSDFVMEFSIKTESCSIKNKENEDIFYFGSQDSLETIDLKFFKKDSKYYKGQDIEIFVDFKSCHLFFSKSALAQLMTFQSGLAPKEAPSNKVDENIMKIFFGYKISQICIDFFKDVRDVGRFSLGSMNGKVLFEGSTAVLGGELESMQIMWKDKESGNYATLVDLANGMNFKYGLQYQKDLVNVNAALVSSQILYVPNVIKSVKGYFKELASVGNGKQASVESQQVVTAEILIENFKFLAKKRLMHQKQFDFEVKFAKIITRNNVAQVELGEIQGNSSHLLFSHERTLVTVDKGLIGVQSNDVGLYLTSSDLHYLLNFFDPDVNAQPKQVKPFEIEAKVTLENFSLHLIDDLNSLAFHSDLTLLELSGNEQVMSYGLSTQNSYCSFQNKEVFKLLNDGSQVAFVQMSQTLLDINLSSVLFNYNSVFISFFKEFIDITLAVEVSSNPNPILIPYEYKVTVPRILLCIDFNNIKTNLESELLVKYRVHTWECDVDLLKLFIFNQNDQELEELLNKVDLSLQLKFGENPSYFISIPAALEVFINLENLKHFYNFYNQDFPKPPVSKNELVISTKYQFKYYQITLNLLTRYREPFIKTVLLHDQFKGVISNETELEIISEISFDYFSPLLQEYECLMEPLNFQILYSYNILPTPNSNLTISLIGEQKVSFCLTDTLLIDLYSRFYEKVPKIKHCSIFNNTGLIIQLQYTDGSIQLIHDQDTQQMKPIKLGDYLSLAVNLEDGSKAYLNRVPLYIEGIHNHTLIDKKIDINTEIQISGQSKLIKVSSPIEIKNNTQNQFHIIFYTKDSTNAHSSKTIEPNQIISVPLICCKGRAIFIPPNTGTSQCNQVEFSKIIQASPFCKSGDFYFVLKYSKNIIYIMPSISLKNALPTYISVSMGSGPESIIEPNEFLHFYLAPKMVALNLTVNGFNKCKPIFVFDKKIIKKVPLTNSQFSTEIGLLYDEEENVKITFYPHYLISNLSLIPLSFFVQSKNNYFEISKNYRSNKFFIGKVESLKVAVGEVTSAALNMDSMNRVPFEIKSKNSIFHFVHETVTAKLPGVSRFTKIFCVYSRVMFTNFMEQDVRIIQTGTDERNFTFLKPKQRNYFNWVTYQQDYFLVSIRVDRVSSEWSGGFSINESDTFYVNIENPDQRFFVKVDVKDQNGIISVFLYNSYESDLKITNLCSFDIQAHQQDYPVPILVPAGSSEFFAWHSKSLKQVLTMKFKVNHSVTRASFDFSEVNQLLEFPVEDDAGKLVFAMIYKEANSHNVVVSENPIEKYQKPHPSLRFSFKFPIIFLSFIQHDIYKKKEIMLLTLTNLVFNITQYGLCFEWKIALSDLQFDSQIDKFVVCPIFFVSDGEHDLTATGKIVSTSKWMCLEDLNIDMKNFVVNADSNLIESVLDYYKRFVSEISSPAEDYYNYNETVQNQPNAWIFLSTLRINSFVIRFSYKNLPNNFQDHFKSYLINFDDIMVFLDMTNFSKIYGSPSTIMNTLTSSYTTMIMSNVDLILKQHGMIGGALMLALKFSNGIAKIGKKSKKQKETQQIYKDRLKHDKTLNTMRFTRCLKSSDLNSKTLNKLQGKEGVDAFADLINNPMNGFLNLFKPKKKNKTQEEENVVIKYKQRPNRVFYGMFSLVKPFNFEDCETVMTLREIDPDYSKFLFYGQVTGTDYKSQNKLKLAVFDQVLVLLGNENKILWEINPIFIESAEKVKERFVIRGADKKGKTVEHVVTFLEQNLLDRAKELIREVKRDSNN